MIEIESAGLTDVGQKREGNEDAFFVDEKQQIFVVADGMGGHLAGEVASGIVVDTFGRFARGEDDCTEFAVPDDALSAEATRLVSCIRKANHEVFTKSRSDENCRGMGSTVAAIHSTGDTIIAANVGDSPIYFVRDGDIELISVMHTVAAEQAAIDPERLKLLPEKFLHMLSRAIGVSEDVQADVCETQCFKGDSFLLCSDGLSNLVAPNEMADIVSNNSAEEACRKFVDMANERGGDDNITVIVLRVKEVGSRKGTFRRFVMRLLGL